MVLSASDPARPLRAVPWAVLLQGSLFTDGPTPMEPPPSKSPCKPNPALVTSHPTWPALFSCEREARAHAWLCPLGSLVLWPRSQEVPGKMCVTSLRSLTQTNQQVPSSPSSPKFYWARENEGKLKALSPHQHCALPAPTALTALAWTQACESASGTSLGHCPFLPLPAELSEWAMR